MKNKIESFWPQTKGIGGKMYDVLTVHDPITNNPLCKDCWDGKHKRDGCKIPGCLCGCYNGRNKGLSSARKPAKDCEENQTLPDVGAIQV